AGIALAVCVACSLVIWNWQGARGEAALNALRSDYSAQVEQAHREAEIVREKLNAEAREAAESYEATIREIEANSRPDRVIRIPVRVCDVPAGSPGGDPSGDSPGAA